jgi:DNA-binding MarR family transcriptional regulator
MRPAVSAESASRRPAPAGTRWTLAPRHSPRHPHVEAARGHERPAAAPREPVAAQRLYELTEELGRLVGEIAQAGLPPAAPALDSEFVRSLIRERQRRSAAFGADLFANPVWDMMLDLLAARLEGRAVRTSSLCIAAGVPGTTALRWIRELTERGLFVRVPDPLDGRGILIELSNDAAERLLAHLAAGAEGLSR